MRSSDTPASDHRQGEADWSDETPSDEQLDPNVLERLEREAEPELDGDGEDAGE